MTLCYDNYIWFFFKDSFYYSFWFFFFPIFSVTFTLLPFLKPHSDNRRFKQPQQQQQPASGVPGDHARVSGGDTRVSGSSQMASNNNGGVQIHQPQHRPQQHTNGVLLKASQKDLQSKYHLLSKTNKTVMGWVIRFWYFLPEIRVFWKFPPLRKLLNLYLQKKKFPTYNNETRFLGTRHITKTNLTTNKSWAESTPIKSRIYNKVWHTFMVYFKFLACYSYIYLSYTVSFIFFTSLSTYFETLTATHLYSGPFWI